MSDRYVPRQYGKTEAIALNRRRGYRKLSRFELMRLEAKIRRLCRG